jgi:acetolactate synthase-like protein
MYVCMQVKVFIYLGPVFVEFPIDILYPYALVKKEVIGSGMGRGLRAQLVSW